MNRIRSQHRINVHGCDVPDPVCTFEELQSEYRLNPRVLQNLKDAGLNSPTPIQMQAIPLMMHVSADTHIQWLVNNVETLCDDFCVSGFLLRVGSCWPALPRDQERLWLFVFRCSPTCSNRPTWASELWSSLRPENWPTRYTNTLNGCFYCDKKVT